MSLAATGASTYIPLPLEKPKGLEEEEEEQGNNHNNDNGSGSDMSSSAPSVDTGPKNGGVSKGVKLALLVVLCLQNAVYTMLRRYRYVLLFPCLWRASSCFLAV